METKRLHAKETHVWLQRGCRAAKESGARTQTRVSEVYAGCPNRCRRAEKYFQSQMLAACRRFLAQACTVPHALQQSITRPAGVRRYRHATWQPKRYEGVAVYQKSGDAWESTVPAGGQVRHEKVKSERRAAPRRARQRAAFEMRGQARRCRQPQNGWRRQQEGATAQRRKPERRARE